MRPALLLLALLSGCWGSCPDNPGWEATPEAVARRMGGEYVASCIRIRGCVAKQRCLDEVENGYCVDAGVPGCSRNEPEGLCS